MSTHAQLFKLWDPVQTFAIIVSFFKNFSVQ